MLREFTQFENNADGGDVHILFDKTAINANANAKKRGFTLKTILFLATVGVFVLIFLNIFVGFPKFSTKKSDSSNNSEKTKNSDLKMLFSGVEMNFSWISNRENQELIFNFNFNQSLDKNQWFLIGFLNGKRVSGADFCLFKDGTVADGFINSQNELKMDKNQDCEIVESKDSKISIKRKWTTCDPHDYAFESGTTQVLFALETGTPEKLPADHHIRHFRFFDKVFPVLDSEDHKGIVFAVENVSFKADTSWCVLTKLDSDVLATKKHIVGWEPVITPGNEAFVEKIEVLLCRYDQESTIASSLFCDSNMTPLEMSNCTVPLAVWTASQPKFEFPSKAGQPFGGKNSLSWILIKVTYSKITSKITDSSGLKVIYTEKLRKYDSGILQVGISDISDAVIPPKQSDLILNGFCISNCSEKLGEKEIHVFGGQFHGHSTARKIRTSVFRNGKRIQTLFAEDDFDSDFTTIERIEPVKVEKGDVIVTTCHFDSSDKDQWTNLKDSSEPCVNYLFYYPASDLSFCQSTIDESSLKQFFASKGVQDNNYSSLNLNQSIVQELQNLYFTSNLTIQCLKTDKQPYPDHPQTWNQESRPRFDPKTLVEKSRISDECPAAND